MRLLLISNSTNPGEPYLGYPKNNIKEFLGNLTGKAIFIPYAAVTFSYDDYEAMVSERFREIGIDVESVHHFEDRKSAIENAPAIVIGGGNTWQLLKLLIDNDLIGVIRKKVISGTPYVGWSAGSNVACPTIRTTNDMPVVEPVSFSAINLIPFQINPHYTDANPVGHAGETREQRIEEFIEVNPSLFVVGLREGTMLLCENEKIRLLGNKSARIFKKGISPRELSAGDDLSFLLRR
jgi:dipeptidase E